MVRGNLPADGGHLILSKEEKEFFTQENPVSKKYIKPLLGSREFLQDKKRWCIWLVDAIPSS